MVFSFFMLNAIFVLTVFLLQQQKEFIFIIWPFAPKVNVSYEGPKVSQHSEISTCANF